MGSALVPQQFLETPHPYTGSSLGHTEPRSNVPQLLGDDRSSLFFPPQGLRVVSRSNDDAHLKSSRHMGNV